ncbi:sec14 cytosolic factor like protein [Zymoseptoria brevis]|uniref:Sec14 cytosolic factor like protein n=1 Tax=Zymoseptoria brevis TaxID=1047168 RepID=A0A0F4GL07_9PEZI|nr:sec14 cytosolic factor like protein [Zymoseptoria brevis]
MAAAPHLETDPKYDDYDFPTTAPTPQSGHPGHTTKEQDAAVFQLRSILEQEGYSKRLDTLTLLRYLRARKFDVNLSKQMWIDSEKWRSEFGGGVDELVKTFDYQEKPQVFAYYPQYYHKTDKDGRPVYIEQLGKVDLEKLRTITTDDRMLQNLVVEYEKLADPRLPACSRKSGQLLETCCSIFDLKGVGLSKASQVYGYVQRASAISQNHYPERLGKFYIINAPWGFSGVFSMVKRFLDPVTVAKIHVLGSGFQKELLGQVPKENLPSEFGGDCKCPGGCMLSDMGPWQDKEWARPAKWEKEKAAASGNAIPATEPAVGEGLPAGSAGQPAAAPQGVVAGQPAPAAQ